MEKVKVHNTSDVQTNNIGYNTVIWQFCVILKGAIIGNNCNINCMVFIENDVRIGDNVTVKSGVQIWDGIKIEDDVFIGPNVTFTNDLIPRSKQYPTEFSKTVIKKGASIGANSSIIAGVTIGSYSLVGAGSVITKSIPDYSVFYGNPASHKGYITKEGVILDLDLTNNGESYEFLNNELIKKK
jgi:UDP-2-acetamido-3-amino-2,3-dideoxy-glucuronate N-acetyltransferase